MLMAVVSVLHVVEGTQAQCLKENMPHGGHNCLSPLEQTQHLPYMTKKNRL